MDCEGCEVWPFECAEDRVLMVAAPELLQALKELLEWHERPEGRPSHPLALTHAREAIAKATTVPVDDSR